MVNQQANGKLVYRFGEGKADGDAGMRDLLGGKGANLAEMANLGLPVPPGFTITTEVCTGYYKNGGTYPEIPRRRSRCRHGRGRRSGRRDVRRCQERRCWFRCAPAPGVSMPGMMDTVLNLGLNDATVEGLASRARRPPLRL